MMPPDPTTLPEDVLETMASAMLDPVLDIEASTPGNIIRKQVLLRCLKAAAELGWTLQPEPS